MHRRDPDTKDVVNESTVEEEPAREGVEESVFVQGKVESSPGRGRRSAHGSTSKLPPNSVTESEDVVLHDKPEGFHEGLGRDARESSAAKVGTNKVQSAISRDARVHRHGIGYEKASTGREDEIVQLLFEIKGALEVGSLGLCGVL